MNDGGADGWVMVDVLFAHVAVILVLHVCVFAGKVDLVAVGVRCDSVPLYQGRDSVQGPILISGAIAHVGLLLFVRCVF